MKLQLIALALAASTVATVTAAKDSRQEDLRQARKEMAALRAGEAEPAVATTGDADSFGRNVKFAGLLNSGVVTLANDCTPDPDFPPGADDRCFVTNPAPSTTSFRASDVGRMLIPARSVNTTLCHWQTPYVVYAFHNPTDSYQSNARISVTPVYTIQNPVLNDPSLVDPTTGEPYNGSITMALAGVRHGRGLQPGDFHVERDSTTRVCMGGLITQRALIETYGLSKTQAANFFKNDTVITLDIIGSANLVDFASIIVGTRFVTD